MLQAEGAAQRFAVLWATLGPESKVFLATTAGLVPADFVSAEGVRQGDALATATTSSNTTTTNTLSTTGGTTTNSSSTTTPPPTPQQHHHEQHLFLCGGGHVGCKVSGNVLRLSICCILGRFFLVGAAPGSTRRSGAPCCVQVGWKEWQCAPP